MLNREQGVPPAAVFLVPGSSCFVLCALCFVLRHRVRGTMADKWLFAHSWGEYRGNRRQGTGVSVGRGIQRRGGAERRFS